jgi:hypothetical protein
MPSFESFLNLHYSIPLPVRDPLRAFKYLKIDNTPTLRPLHSNPPQKVVPLLLPSQPSLASLSLRSPTSPDPPPSTLTEDPYSNSSEEPTILFQLRNRTILGPPTKNPGLDFDPDNGTSKRGRGRTSLLSKAQSRARLDIASGRQQSIFGALRAVQAPGRVTP